MRLQDFADVIGQEIEITYYPNQQGRWCAWFRQGEIKDGRILSSEYGNGKTPDEACTVYARHIAGKQIVFYAMDKEIRQVFNVPNDLT